MQKTSNKKPRRSEINTNSQNPKIKILSAKNTRDVATHTKSRLQGRQVHPIFNKMSQMRTVRCKLRPKWSRTSKRNDQSTLGAARPHVLQSPRNKVRWRTNPVVVEIPRPCKSVHSFTVRIPKPGIKSR